MSDVDNFVALDALRKALERNPEMRVCQLIVNATGRSDLFYVEDAELTASLRSYGTER